MTLAAVLRARFALLVTGRVGLLLISILVMAILTRHLGPTGFGHYRAAVAYLGLIVLLLDLGLGSIFVREISREGADQARIISNALALRLVVAVFAMLFAVILAQVLGFDEAAKRGIAAGSVGFVAYSVHLMLFGLFQQKLRQLGVVIAEIGGGAILLAAVVSLSKLGAEPVWFVAALGFSYLCTLSGTLYYARRLVRFGLRTELRQWSHLATAALPVAGMSILTVTAYRADSVLLALLNGPEAVGLYGVPLKVFESLMGIVILFVGLFAPLMARSAKAAPAEFSALLGSGLGVMCMGAAGAAVGLNAVAPELIALLAGPEFAAAEPILRLLMLLAVAHGLTLFLREAATALYIQKRLLPGYAAGLVVALLGYFVLIPRYSGVGAATALIISEMLVLSYALAVVVKASPERASLRLPVLAALCGAGAGAVLYAIHLAGWNVVGRVGASIAVYVLLLLVTRAIKISDVLAVAREVGGLPKPERSGP
jgi:O-antigen/teichoic acid export membrane protein